MSDHHPDNIYFKNLSLSNSILEVLDEIGYEKPSPIQAAIIPKIKSGHDVVGQAQTGTGKTAAFALPLLSRINIAKQKVQVMVLTPTRELAIQVSEAFQRYASKMKGFHVLPIYGGQNYSHQIKQLRNGVHVVVGTPGRIMDHMRRKSLNLENLECLVLDEADEMLRMGFIEDVEWVLDQIPTDCQKALLSATMPPAIRKIAIKYLTNAKEITIKSETVTASSVKQKFWSGPENLKLDVLTRILEYENFDGVIIFVRTKLMTTSLKERLEARGFSSEALNGDILQAHREKAIDSFKKGKYDVLVATDVAARGLDVDRITHVINYDIPYDTEAYTHRIGRTGRAGRKGEAILFVTPREMRLLRSIEKATNQTIEPIILPSTEKLNDQRIQKLKDNINDMLGSNLGIFLDIVKSYHAESGADLLEIAAALMKMSQGNTPLLLKDLDIPKSAGSANKRQRQHQLGSKKKFSEKPKRDMQKYRLDIGSMHGVKPGNIVGAIANEAKISSSNIGQIRVYEKYSHVDLPVNFPSNTLHVLSKARVVGRLLKLFPVKENTKRQSTKEKYSKQKKGKNKKI